MLSFLDATLGQPFYDVVLVNSTSAIKGTVTTAGGFAMPP